MDPFSRGEHEEQGSSAPSNPPDGDTGTAPGADAEGWQTAPDTGPPDTGATDTHQGYGAQGADSQGHGYQGAHPYGQGYQGGYPYGQQYQGAYRYGQQYRYPGYGNYGYPGYGYWNPQAQSQAQTRHRGRTALLVIAVVAGLMVLVAGFGGGIGAALLLGHDFNQPQASTPPSTGGGGNGNGGGGGNPNGNGGNGGSGATGSIDLSKLASRLDPAIVDINGVQTNAQGQTVGEDAGTGVILTSSGEVLTNNHVIEGNSSMTATLSDGRTVPVKVLGEDPTADIALVQLQGVHGLPTINIKTGATAHTGDAVAAFGNALGQGGTPASSQGSITGTDQTITASLDGGAQDTETLTGMIEESAQICAGDSGGVLADAQGHYLGMLTAASSSGNGGNGGNPGYPGDGGNGGNGGSGNPQASSDCSNDGFVIPAGKIIPVINQIESGQRTASVIIGVPGYLGVEVSDSQFTTGQGAQVVGLVANGGAAQAGLPQTFVITAIDGQSVTDPSSLSKVLQQYTPGTTVQVTWNDGQGGASQTTNVTLGSGPPA